MIQCRRLTWGPVGAPLTPPLDFSAARGTLTIVAGTNGIGKSSLLKTLAGLQKPLSGHIETDAKKRGDIAYLVQQQQLDRQFPVSLLDLVSAGLWRSRQSSTERRERVKRVLANWHLTGLERRPLLWLSGGELQRAMLARLDLTGAPLLLLDEPEISLDELGQTLLRNRLGEWRAEGRTLIVVSHDAAALNAQADQCLLLRRDGCYLQTVEKHTQHLAKAV